MWYKFELEYCNFRTLNVISTAATKKIAMVYIKKGNEKKLKCLITKKQLNTKEDSDADIEGYINYKPYGK